MGTIEQFEPLTGITFSQWCEMELDYPSELLNGQVLPRECDSWADVQAMGTSLAHKKITRYLIDRLRQELTLAGSPCDADGGDMRVPVHERSSGDTSSPGPVTGFEPDVYIVCDESKAVVPGDFERQAIYPCVVMEVVSPGSRSRDYADKVEGYLSTEFVKHYLILDPIRVRLTHYRADQPPRFYTAESSEQIELEPPGIRLPASDFFGYLAPSSND